MNYIFSIVSLLFLFLTSCNSNKEKTSGPDTNPGQSLTECFRYATAKDTITLKLIHVGNAITGALIYKLYEKDLNLGTIQGSMKDNLLVANYTFISEGIQSIRQVAFRKEGNSFIEGYGDQVINNDRVTFRNIDSLKFDTIPMLRMVDCKAGL